MSLYNFGSADMSGALGNAPAGVFSGLDPSAAGAAGYNGTALGGGLAGQLAGSQGISAPGAGGGSDAAMAMMMMQALNKAGSSFQTPQQSVQFGQFQQPASPLLAPTIGRALTQG